MFFTFRGVGNQRTSCPETASRGKQDPRAFLEAPGVEFGAIWGSFVAPFGSNFRPFSDRFSAGFSGIIFGTFSAELGSHLEPF